MGSKIEYSYVPTGQFADRRRNATMDHDVAMRDLGDRVLGGWEARQAYVAGPGGVTTPVAWLISGDGQESVWAIYVGESF